MSSQGQVVERRATSPSSGRFELADSGALAEYQIWREPGGAMVLEIPHTYVPERSRGQGLAAVVVHAAFQYAGRAGMRVLPTCTYVEGPFLEGFPDLKQICYVPKHRSELTPADLPNPSVEVIAD